MRRAKSATREGARPIHHKDGRRLGDVIEAGGAFLPKTAKGLPLAPCATFRAAAAALRAIAGKPQAIALGGQHIGAIAGTAAHAAAFDHDGALIGVYPRQVALQVLIVAALGQMELPL
jgi:hypothetical protein